MKINMTLSKRTTLTDRLHLGVNIAKTIIFPGTGVVSDHDLVMMSFQIAEQCADIEDALIYNNTKLADNLVREKQAKMNTTQDKKGNILTEDIEKMENGLNIVMNCTTPKAMRI
ncbi:hypothetical protein PoB_002591900 [Plakobranchus ocellatus]|uniref:Uncharacterized protein n=1 Tax=Plakobranchus ocellatus TaxID=259542 RepID=A0AAV3ZZQ3_9GAST|nr:hypothetical protein PoB_002591900 [Plakobranchus ocellatus]